VVTRVLVVDDSQGMRDLLVAILGSDPELSVAGVACDGEEAVRKTIALRPDVISMDLRMPRMDGVRAIRAIMDAAPTPIVVLHATRRGRESSDIGFDALRAGALEVVEKPMLASAEDVRAFRRSFGSLLKLMAEVKVVRVFAREAPDAEPALREIPAGRPAMEVVGVCSSTGGPSALERVFSSLTGRFPAPILVVQHMAEGFLENFVEWMDANGPLESRIARAGECPRMGVAYFAPDGAHLKLGVDGRIRLDPTPPIRGHCPSGDVLLESLADVSADRALGVVLTGMGEDGARGAGAIAEAGGIVIAQDEASSIVYGMPRAVVELGVPCEVVSLDAIATRLVEWVTTGSGSANTGSRHGLPRES
jgi:two-component system chemotaxis response regulator CheB